jgi:ATP-binding cassette subfamily F protein 3
VKEAPAAKQEPKAAPIDKGKQKEQRRLQKRFEELESSINKLQQEKEALEGRLAAPEVYSDKNLFLDTEKQYASVNRSLGAAEREYEEVFEKLSAMS